MRYVIDASVVIAALVPEENSEAARAVMLEAKLAGVQAPGHLSLEVTNGLLMKHRRELIDSDYLHDALDRFTAYGVTLDTPRDRDQVLKRGLDLAERQGLTMYDAAYLELATRDGMILATFDKALRRAAVALGLDVAPPA